MPNNRCRRQHSFEWLDRGTRIAVSVHGAQTFFHSDSGPKFVSRAILCWLHAENIQTAAIDPGKPWQNGLNENFNGKIRDDCLAMQRVTDRFDAKILIVEFRRDYTEARSHSSLGQLTRGEFKRSISTTTP